MTPREIVDAELKVVRKMFDAQKEILPMVVFVHGHEHGMMPLIFRNDREKDACSDAIRLVVKKMNPDAVVYMSEAWTVNIKTDEFPKDLPRPSEHKDRVEIVAVMIEFKTGEKFSAMAQIHRAENSVTLGEFDVSQDQMLMGRFADFYAPERTH